MHFSRHYTFYFQPGSGSRSCETRNYLHIAKPDPVFRKVNTDINNHHFGVLPKWIIILFAMHFKETMTF